MGILCKILTSTSHFSNFTNSYHENKSILTLSNYSFREFSIRTEPDKRYNKAFERNACTPCDSADKRHWCIGKRG